MSTGFHTAKFFSQAQSGFKFDFKTNLKKAFASNNQQKFIFDDIEIECEKAIQVQLITKVQKDINLTGQKVDDYLKLYSKLRDRVSKNPREDSLAILVAPPGYICESQILKKVHQYQELLSKLVHKKNSYQEKLESLISVQDILAK